MTSLNEVLTGDDSAYFHDLDSYIATLLQTKKIPVDTFSYKPPFRFFTLINGSRVDIPCDAVTQVHDKKRNTLGMNRWWKTTRSISDIPA